MNRRASLTTPLTIVLSDDLIVSAMAAAIDAARSFEGATAPNPPVGCLLLDAAGDVISIAAHQKAGQLHAEALAIQMAHEAGLASHIHTVVVTLEPCNHQGRTPPCTEAILSTTAKVVVIGMADPNPLVQGGGVERLRAAGLVVSLLDEAHQPALAQALKRLLAPFTKRMTQGLPWVTVKQAINREGTMLPQPGRKTFTSRSSLELAHTLRRRADAIVTGSGTILADAPEFTVRQVEEIVGKRRKLVLFDRRRRIPNGYIEAATRRGFEVIFGAELEPVLRALANQGVLEVLIEAGPQLTAAVLSSPYWDEHVVITQSAPSGGEDQIDIRHNTTSPAQSVAEERHVFRHH
jgi:diaminohydroxyphosphoribosylaminopyrimidine deaminase / 5-amino-6-(5-phosphoribosylamino)uracil reductase